jgi:hypothetical protein
MGKRYKEPLKIKRLNISMKEQSRLDSIGYYWNDETISEVAALLKKMRRSIFTELHLNERSGGIVLLKTRD